MDDIEKRLGRFTLPLYMLFKKQGDVKIVYDIMMSLKFAAFHISTDLSTQSTDFIGVSPFFDEIEEHEVIPAYNIEIDESGNEFKVTVHRKT